MATIGLGLIGTGKHGRRYIRHVVRDAPGFHLAAIARRDTAAGEALAAELGCRHHARWEALVEDPQVEAVAVVVPPTLHAAIATAVARSGKALLIEKPLAPDPQSARRIVDEVHAAGVPALMAHTLRWNGVVRAVIARLPTLGPLRALTINQRFEPSPLAWLDDPAVSGGGMILHTGIHGFDLVRCLTGTEVRRVTCRTSRTHTRRTEDNFVAVCELEDSPALVTVSGSRDTLGRSGLIDAACTQGQLVADHQQHWAHTVTGLTRDPLDLPEPTNTVLEALRALVATIRSGTPVPVSLEDGAGAVLIADACARSARLDTPVDVERL